MRHQDGVVPFTGDEHLRLLVHGLLFHYEHLIMEMHPNGWPKHVMPGTIPCKHLECCPYALAYRFLLSHRAMTSTIQQMMTGGPAADTGPLQVETVFASPQGQQKASRGTITVAAPVGQKADISNGCGFHHPPEDVVDDMGAFIMSLSMLNGEFCPHPPFIFALDQVVNLWKKRARATKMFFVTRSGRREDVRKLMLAVCDDKVFAPKPAAEPALGDLRGAAAVEPIAAAASPVEPVEPEPVQKPAAFPTLLEQYAAELKAALGE